MRDTKIYPNLPDSETIIAIRFDGSLYFANVSYFEDAILEAVVDKPNAKYLLVVGGGINQLDASGEETLHQLNERLRENGVILVFSSLKRQILDVMRSAGLMKVIGEENIHATEDMALEYIYKQLGDQSDLELHYRLLKTQEPK